MTSINTLNSFLFPPLPLISWFGLSGIEYRFRMHRIGATMPTYGGLYVFAIGSNWTALYVGKAKDFNDRICANLRQHHRFAEAVRLGATHIGICQYTGEFPRALAERDLINGIDPMLNRQ